MAPKHALYDRLGGEGAISAVVEEFYKVLQADNRVKKFFTSTNMDKLKKHQKAFLTVAFGGPSKYEGKDLKAAHSALGISDADFGAVAEDLVKVLKGVGVAQNLIDEVVAIVGSVKGDIVVKPLIDRLGGEGAISAVVDEFYKVLLADVRVKKFFESTDMKKLKSHQKAFLTVAFGGPNKYKGKELKAAHSALGITETDFGAVAEDLVKVLKEMGVAQNLIDEVVGIVGSVKGDIVVKPLIDRLGGEGAIAAVVDEFYKVLLADDRVKKFFESTDMKKLKSHQKAFLTVAFGGPNSYKGKELKAAHSALGIKEADFGAVAEDLIKVLKDMGVAQNLIDEVVGIVGSVKGDIVVKPLFDRLGGEGAISAVVDEFYKVLLADDRVKKFFDSTEMNKLKSHQKAFLTVAFGGPNSYKGKDLKAAHAQLGVTDEAFGAVAEDLVKVLKSVGVAQNLIDEVVGIVGSVKGDIVVKPLFDRLGGEGAISAVVDELYNVLLADGRVKKFFESTDMNKLKGHQKAFLTVAFGGPNSYKGKELKAAHSTLGISDDDFGAVAEDLVKVLNSVGVAENLIDEVVAIVSSVKDDIVRKPLYLRLGGADAISAVVDDFYKGIIANPRLLPYFVNSDVNHIKRHQTNFLILAFGGPSSYSGKSIAEAHAGLKITPAAFQLVGNELSTVLKKHGVPDPLIEEVMGVVATLQDDVCERTIDSSSIAGKMLCC